MALALSLAAAAAFSAAQTDEDIHDFLVNHSEGQGVIYYKVPGQELDQASIDRITEQSDVLEVDGTIPEFYDNVQLAKITEMPWLIAF